MTKCIFTTAVCQAPFCGKTFQRDQFHPNLVLCPECRRQRNRENNRINMRAKYHAMKEEDREIKEEGREKYSGPTRWDLYRARKRRERLARRERIQNRTGGGDDFTIRIKRMFSGLKSPHGNTMSEPMFLMMSLQFIILDFLSHGCLDDFREHLNIVLKKICHEPGGSASPEQNASCMRMETFLHAVGKTMPFIRSRLAPSADSTVT